MLYTLNTYNKRGYIGSRGKNPHVKDSITTSHAVWHNLSDKRKEQWETGREGEVTDSVPKGFRVLSGAAVISVPSRFEMPRLAGDTRLSYPVEKMIRAQTFKA